MVAGSVEQVVLGPVAGFAQDRAMALEVGAAARRAALARYSLARFLGDWDRLFMQL